MDSGTDFHFRFKQPSGSVLLWSGRLYNISGNRQCKTNPERSRTKHFWPARLFLPSTP